MESFYHNSLPGLAQGYTCIECNTDVVANIPGVPRYPSAIDTVVAGGTISETRPGCVDNLPPVGVTFDSGASITSESTGHGDPASAEASQRLATNQGTLSAQYVDTTTDRAKRLGLIPGIPKVSEIHESGWPTEKQHIPRMKEPEIGTRSGWNAVDWEKLNEISRSARRSVGDTNVNLRMPSPPRASKRKQDLTSTSYNDADVQVTDPEKKICGSSGCGATAVSADELSSTNTTPISTPTVTPLKGHPSGTPSSTPGRTLTSCSEYSSSSGLDSPVQSRSRGDKRRHKPNRVLFPDSTNSAKRGLGARANPLGAAWAKDYQEADSNAYTKALLEHVEHRISTNLERNYRIPPSCLTRSSLCRVVLFDHDDKGLEASVHLSPNEVVTEVRGQFLLLEEYEHYVDPLSEYNRYVLFYNGFGDRGVVIDTGQYGNNARFIRRSCIPNCRLEHYVVQGKLLIVIRTSMEVMPGTELTIPFDLDYQTCRYSMDCACARSRCPVLKWGRKLQRNKVVPNLDYSKFIETRLRVLSKPLSQESPNKYEHCLSGSPLMKASLGPSSLPGSPSSFSASFSPNRVLPTLGVRSPLTGAPLVSSCARSVRPSTSTDLDELDTQSTLRYSLTHSAPLATQSLSHDQTDKSTAESRFENARLLSVTDENERPDDVALSQASSSGREKSTMDCRSETNAPCRSARSDINDATKLAFEPIITTRRQAAAMRSALQ